MVVVVGGSVVVVGAATDRSATSEAGSEAAGTVVVVVVGGAVVGGVAGATGAEVFTKDAAADGLFWDASSQDGESDRPVDAAAVPDAVPGR